MTTTAIPTTTGPIADLVRFLQDPGHVEALVARAAAVLGSRADAEDAVSDRLVRFLENPPAETLRRASLLPASRRPTRWPRPRCARSDSSRVR